MHNLSYLFCAKQREHRDEISRDTDQHEDYAADGGEVQQPPWIADEEDHRSRILQHLLDRHVAAAVAPGVRFVARHPPISHSNICGKLNSRPE